MGSFRGAKAIDGTLAIMVGVQKATFRKRSTLGSEELSHGLI